MAWNDTKVDGSSTLPANEYNSMVSVIENQGYTVIIYKDGANYIARNGATGAIISSNTNFSTVCQAAGDSITGNGIIFIKDPGSDIVPTSTVTFTNKEIFVTSDFAKIDISSLDNIAFLFQDTVQEGYKVCGISNFRMKGDQTKTNQIFVKFNDVRAIVDNLIATQPDYMYCVVYLYGGNYLSRITNVQAQAIAGIVVEGYGSGDLNAANGTRIDHCDVGYLAGDYSIKITQAGYIIVSNCYLEGSKTGIYASGGSYTTILGNYITATVAGINVGGFYTTVSDNSVYINGAGGIGINIPATFYGPTITGNKIYTGANNNFIGIKLNGIVTGTITGNIIEIDGTPTGTYGIRGVGVHDQITIIGNVVAATSAITGTAIFFDDLYWSSIVGNVLYNWSIGLTITTNILVNIGYNHGYKSENWGTSTGTGTQQTIAHGLAAMPSLVLLSDKELDAKPYQSAAKDATNIYITAVANQDYSWYVKV